MNPKVLIVRFSSIGDIVLTTPVIRCMKQQLEGEPEIHYLVKEQFKPVIQNNPYLTKIHTIKSKVSEVLDELRAERFDFIIDLHNNIRSQQVKRPLSALAFTVDKLNWEKWLMVNLKINRLPKRHIVDRYMDVAGYLNVENDGKGLDYFIPDEEEVNLSILPREFQNGYTAFVIGGAHNTKKLPTHKIISICQKLQTPVVLLGGNDDSVAGQAIKTAVGEMVYDACGKFSINQSASLVKQAGKVITHDTGLMHIAAAFKKDIISVWGNTIPEFGMYPYLPKGEGSSKCVEVSGLRCRPCTKLGHDKCPKKHFKCMELVDEELIYSLK